jgi:hypothetical protein
MQVPRLALRLRTFLLKFEAPLQLADAQQALEAHRLAQQELAASPLFAALLQRALAVGNFLNWGSRLGAAGGFRLKSLRKLQVSGAAICVAKGLLAAGVRVLACLPACLLARCAPQGPG